MLSGHGAADQLTAALGTPNPTPGQGPAQVTVFAVREMVTADFLTDPGDPAQPALHPDQVAVLAARPDLAERLAEAVPLGPDQAAARLGWARHAQEVRVKFGAARGGTVWIPLYRAGDIDQVPADHPEVDWLDRDRQLRTGLPTGRALHRADRHTIRFHQLQRGTADRIRNRRVNERTGDEVDLGDTVKGYDTGEEYVIVEPSELDDIAPGRSKAIEVAGFVDLDAVDPIFFELTKSELYKKAAAAGIEGRSSMTHDQLADALAHTCGRRRKT
ncbi:Ku protein [Streptomyces sp. NPDC050448]|uniref:Ku protein n=1 Tax=Streptomyces sp. NPDC050448 TaxID=3155404 RepID=UPI0034372E73